MISAVVFDFDGVLIDSEPLHFAAYQEVVSSFGIELTPEDYCEHYLGADDRGVFRKLAKARGWELDDSQIDSLVEEKTRAFDAVLERNDVLYPAARSCIERLATEFPLGIASGAFRHEIEMILRRSGIERWFRFIVAAGETARSKPWPDPYARAAQLHRAAPSECVAIEDSRAGIASAKAAGLRCVGITTTYPASELGAADHVIESLEEFTPELIRKLDTDLQSLRAVRSPSAGPDARSGG